MKIKKWLKRIGLGLLTLIVIALFSGFIYEQISRIKSDKKSEEYKKYGELIDVGDHKLFYRKGGKGKPTVVFEPGSPESHTAWIYSGVVNEINEHATTVVYDRAGMLFSERGKRAVNAENISDDLYSLLQKGGFEKPYILVGHSAAGVYLRPFAKEHAKDIQGIVLIDPTHPDQRYRAPEELKKFYSFSLPPRWFLKFGNEVGIVRLLYKNIIHWTVNYGIKSGAVYDELTYIYNEIGSISPPSSFGNIPLVVISADKFPFVKDEGLTKAMEKYKDELHEEIANSSSKGTRIIAKDSEHWMLRTEKELIVNEIVKMIQLNDSTTTMYKFD